MKKVQVTIGTKQLTYETDLDVKVGDWVDLPAFPYAPNGAPMAMVTSLESDYDGPCRSILAIRGAEKEEE